MEPLDILSEHAPAIWAALSSLASGVGAWLLSRRNIGAVLERAKMEANAEVSAAETEERTAFRTTLMTELAAMRQLIKECEVDKEALRERLNTAMTQSLVLRATVEIMEKRVAFCRERHSLLDETANPGEPHGTGP